MIEGDREPSDLAGESNDGLPVPDRRAGATSQEHIAHRTAEGSTKHRPADEAAKLVGGLDERFSYRDPLSFPSLEPLLLGVPGAACGVVIEPPGRERRFVRHAPEFVDDPSDTGMFRTLGVATHVSPPAFALALEPATLIGYRTVLHHCNFCNDQSYGTGVADYLGKLNSLGPLPNEGTRLRATGDGFQFTLEHGDRARRHVDGAVLVLCSNEPSNYGSFLFRVLPKLYAAKQLGLSRLPILVYAELATQRGLLTMAGVETSQIVRHSVDAITSADRMVLLSLRNPSAFLDMESRQFFCDIRRQFGEPPGSRRLYVSRLSHAKAGRSGRIMTNEQELIDALTKVGFEVVEPEKLRSEEQVRIFSSAELIVGPSGAGMFNTVFCHPGTKVVDIESEPHWIYAHAGLFASCALRYGIFVGAVDETDPRPVHRRWSVDVKALVERVRSFA